MNSKNCFSKLVLVSGCNLYSAGWGLCCFIIILRKLSSYEQLCQRNVESCFQIGISATLGWNF